MRQPPLAAARTKGKLPKAPKARLLELALPRKRVTWRADALEQGVRGNELTPARWPKNPDDWHLPTVLTAEQLKPHATTPEGWLAGPAGGRTLPPAGHGQ